MVDKGLVIVISAPSGAGKTTICHEVVKKFKNVIISVSATTRSLRPGEIDGKDYFFIDEKKFKKMAQGNEFAEWAFVHDSYYGTPKKILEEAIKKGKDIILEIDVQGGMKIKKIYPDAVFVFIMPPSFKALANRLSKRAKDTEKTIRLRINNAKKEISYMHCYDYLVINDRLGDAVGQVKSIIEAERRKTKRLNEEINKLFRR